MKALFNKENMTMKITPENMEDLWHLHRVIEKEDVARGHSFRRYKLSSLMQKLLLTATKN